MISRLRFAGPTRAVRRGGSEVGGSVRGERSEDMGAEVSAEGEEVMNSEREGPALSWSENRVACRRDGG